MLFCRSRRSLLLYGVAVALGILFSLNLILLTSDGNYSKLSRLPSIFTLRPHTSPHRSSPKTLDEVDIHLLIPLSDIPSDETAPSESGPAPYCQTILTSLLRGYTPILLDLGNQVTWEKGTSLKIDVVASYLEKLENSKSEKEQIVFMIDGWDVWMQLGPEELIQRYYDSNQGIILGADKMCWPSPPDLPQACVDVPSSPFAAELYHSNESSVHGFAITYTPEQKMISQSPPRFPNSGTLLSTSSVLSSFYKHLISHPIKPHPLAPGLASVPPNDQEYFIRAFYTDHLPSYWGSTPEFGLEVDYATEFFGTTLYALSNYNFKSSSVESANGQRPDGEEGDEESLLEEISLGGTEMAHIGLLSNKITGQTPVAIHFNGQEGKHAANILWHKMEWVTNQTIRESFELRSGVTKGVWVGEVGGRWIDWDALGCQGIWEKT